MTLTPKRIALSTGVLWLMAICGLITLIAAIGTKPRSTFEISSAVALAVVTLLMLAARLLGKR